MASFGAGFKLTHPSAVALPQVSSQNMEEYQFDMLVALLDVGVPHIVMMIMSFLDSRTLEVADQVSCVWRDFMEDLPVWKRAVESNIASVPLWRQLFQKRGWHKYISQEIPHSGSKTYLYRQLHHSISKDIHSLNTNWQRGLYTLTTIETGSPVFCLQFDSVKIVSGHGDNTIKIWDKETLKLLKILTGHQKPVLCLQFTGDILVSGAQDSSVKAWNIQTGLVVNDLLHHKDDVRSLKFNAELLVTGSDDKTVAVWDFKSPTAITLKMVLEDDIYAVELSHSYIFSASVDHSIKVWDKSSGELLHTLQHSDQVFSLQCRGSLIVSGCGDRTIRLWDSLTGSCLREWEGHDNIIESVTFDDQRIVTGGFDKTVKVWSMSAMLEPSSPTDALCIATLKEHCDSVNAVQMDKFQVISGSSDRTIQLYDFFSAILPPQLV